MCTKHGLTWNVFIETILYCPVSSLCRVYASKRESHLETYVYPDYREKGLCWFGKCDKTELRTRQKYADVWGYVTKKYCCSGYLPNKEPIGDEHDCDPVCSKGCPHGKCVGPEYCKCHKGYGRDKNSICSLICFSKCGYGTCSKPNVCECFPGYRRIQNGTCGPYCLNGCPHGRCIRPGYCECDKGYHKDDYDECVPSCYPECGYGTCVSPNQCVCFHGYKINYFHDDSSESLCKPECKHCNGTCISPNTCICEPPYESVRQAINEHSCSSNVCFNTTFEITVCVYKTTTFEVTTTATDENSRTDFHKNDGIFLVTNTETLDFNDTVMNNWSEHSYKVTDANIVMTDDDKEKSSEHNYDDITTESNSVVETIEEENYSMHYVIVFIVAIVLLSLVLLIVKKRTFFTKGSYNIEDKKTKGIGNDKPRNVTVVENCELKNIMISQEN